MDTPTTSVPPILESVFNHIALPPRLPAKQEDRADQIRIERALIDLLLYAVRTLRDIKGCGFSGYWESISHALQTCGTLNSGGKLDKTALFEEFTRIPVVRFVILHVAEQNAGLLIRRRLDGSLIFEAFEASPLSESVLASESALQWDFPGCAVAVPNMGSNTSFLESLATFLEQASLEPIKRFAAHTTKAGSSTIENRDTVDPSLITQMLMTLLEANGSRIFPPLLRKRVRDDVCWENGAEKPWRRCAFWLVLRVGLQRHLCTLCGEERGRIHYKFLICLVLARHLDEALDHLSPDLLVFLKAKLCRRLAKLEAEKEKSSGKGRAIYESMFLSLSPLLHEITQNATRRIGLAWDMFKGTIRRRIAHLPNRADQQDLYLALRNSGPYLQRVLEEPLHNGARSSAPYQLPANYDISAATSQHLRDFTKRYFLLSEMETEVENCNVAVSALGVDLETLCLGFAKKIDEYLVAVADAYDSYPEQKSVMLLTAMELWVLMDECATELFGLLKDYNPGFFPEILDVLQLPRFRDMCRLQDIQKHLHDRHTTCSNSRRTIFDNPAEGCFAERYFNESRDSLQLQGLHQQIKVTAEQNREMKQQEWQELSAEYEGLMMKVAESTCLYTTDDIWPSLPIHDDHQCTKCYLERQAKRMRIRIHEHPLPSDPIQAKAVVFELNCPKTFAAYRDITWKMIGTLAHPERLACPNPKIALYDYSELAKYMSSRRSSLSLASTTKSFLATHYAACRFPVDIHDVCLPNGLKFSYFDTSTKMWPGRQAPKPNFARHCSVPIPANSPFSSLQLLPEFRVDAAGRSSYEIIASQTRCPSELNPHEFMAYQSLFLGNNHRWLSILIELGSSNLNFSTEATASLISRLALQAGPACARRDDPLRAIHVVFRDESFCKRLINQIEQRLESMSSNWRETCSMDMLVTLILRLCSLAFGSTVVGEASKLLERARAITFKWIGLLQVDIHKATDADISRSCSEYAFWAALLCRRTFATHAESGGMLRPAALRCFIECSIALQDNMVGDPAALPPLPKGALIRDLKMVYRLRSLLRESLNASPESLMSAINTAWPGSEGGLPRTSSGLSFLPPPNEWWTELTINATPQTLQQTIHYHLLEGHLLVDGQPLGKLPSKHRKSVILKQLFGNQRLLTYPSNLLGMTYALVGPMCGHEIHLGFRSGGLIIRALVRGSLLELVPRAVFVSPSNFDLPASLIDDCVHWLDLNTGIIDIRQPQKIWKSGPGNWALNFNTRLAQRRTSSLVDPLSPLFQRIAHIFDRFEYRQKLTVFQPAKRNLSVELRRLQLTFVVNCRSRLESPELGSEIDLDQDAGTWYGLDSKLVLRDTTNPRQRSVITPLGPLTCKRNGLHVAIEAENTGDYGRFTINDVLGRLECAAEPLLLYLKAQFHAYTSFVVPDLLTGRTGTEEALHCLKSGFCQPWTPLNTGPHRILMSIAKLTPHRSYYPHDMRYMQQIFWDTRLTTTIQHDEFRPVVDAICDKSQKLSIFAFQQTELAALEPAGDHHLLDRSRSRRRLFERPSLDSHRHLVAPDLCYDARGRCQSNQGRLNVFECASVLCQWPSKMPTTPKLAEILQNWITIGGYYRAFNRTLLSDLLAVEFASDWGSLVRLCLDSEPEDRYRLMFLFAFMSFRNDADMDILRTLMAFAVFEELRLLDPPKWPYYLQFRLNQIPHTEYLTQLIQPCCVPYPEDERSIFQSTLGSKLRKKLEAAERAYKKRVENECTAFTQFLLDQWPCQEPTVEGLTIPELVDVTQALEIIRPDWLRLFQNLQLSHYIMEVQRVLDRHHIEGKYQPPNIDTKQEVLPSRERGDEFPTLSQNLLRKAGPISPTALHPIVPNGDPRQVTGEYDGVLTVRQNGDLSLSVQEAIEARPVAPFVSSEMQELEGIINGIIESKSTVRQQYGQDMMQSLKALKLLNSAPKREKGQIHPAELPKEISEAGRDTHQHFGRLCEAFEHHDSRAQWLLEGGIWPCITPITVLEQLRSTTAFVFGDRMKESIITYASSITTLQRLMRIEDAHLKGNKQRLQEEQENAGHANWEPLTRPDWILLEIDANILIRPGQVNVALATISPSSKSNSVLQMNMGQGKTSCIMPMVAAVLADTRKLLRVVVPKSLLLQTAQLLHARLGGLLGRELRHIPFSRKTSTKLTTTKLICDIYTEIRESSGVMLCLPEHILSFMLSGLQRLSDSLNHEADKMIQLQHLVRRTCRDVLDECDFTLAVRTQLIYPSGPQTTVDGHPHRWETAEALLRLVEGHLWSLQHDFPQSIEVVRRPQGGFPVVFFLRRDVEDALIARLVNDVCGGRTSIVPTRDCTKADRHAIGKFISDAKVQLQVTERIRQILPDNPAVKQNIYLLRGLLVHRILLMTLKKRWNVQYGLHPTRDPIAVPFHAKGVPSEQAEWGHPDVAILFTCLAFYYGGLSIAQLRQSLELILKSDDPSSEYDRWTNSSGGLPDSLRQWNAINVDDETQLAEIWQHVRYNMSVVDYFLNNFVFPKHAKQFHMKLQASGWDIPLFLPGGPASSITTGFSGTNDNKTMMPLTIKQEDLAGLSHTNAEVLTYLLQPRNRQYVLAASDFGKRLSERDLLQQLCCMGIRILIDAGAQILEMNNYNLAKEWLAIDHEAPAAVYFDTGNKPIVLYSNGHTVPLLASPFAVNLGSCLVYLDEAHTRGTDLMMEPSARGALTLGLGQTKDHTVQAAMRLRQLGTSQSVVFIAPPEVHQSIADVRGKKPGDVFDSRDVICWLLEQTCSGIEQLQPLYYSQGTDYCRRAQAACGYPVFSSSADERESYLGALRQTEKQTLVQLYEPKTQPKPAAPLSVLSPEFATFMKELNRRRKCFQDTNDAVHGSALQEVEQEREREVAFEVEAVREVQKPTHYLPFKFPGLHRDIINFVKTGRLVGDSGGYGQAFEALRKTAVGLKYGVGSQATTSRLYVSTEFTKTVNLPTGRPHDNFQANIVREPELILSQRQVNWILWSLVTEAALIIIPEEAEPLIPLLREVETPVTHLLTYSAPVTRKMLHFNDLQYYAVPSLPTGWRAPTWLTIELGIFAGRLYFEYEEYNDLREFLGFQGATAGPAETIEDAGALAELGGTEGGVEDVTEEPEIHERGQQAQSFTKKPLTFLQDWLDVRRKGQDFVHTPMGHVCHGKSLAPSHPFFTRLENNSTLETTANPRNTQGRAGTSEDLSSDNEKEDDDYPGDGEDESGL
ncbi:MAG: hypothetical protein M1839_002804 [Geoglossum umbratile]|nr:MAG: hypothetical protein M1839_002804 [Geoglossum umbratile]